MEQLPPSAEIHPEDDLLAVRGFITVTSEAVGRQIYYLSLMRQHPLFSPSDIEQLDNKVRESIDQNLEALNDFCAGQQPLQVVHDTLPTPAQLLGFCAFDRVRRSYSAYIRLAANRPVQLWFISSPAEIQLAANH